MKLPNLHPQELARIVLSHMAITLWIFLALILFAEAFVLKNSVGKFLSNTSDETLANAQIIRINFAQYEKIEKRLVAGEAFTPENTSENNPFGLGSAK